MGVSTAEVRKLLQQTFTSSAALKRWTAELAENVHELKGLVDEVHWDSSVADVVAELVDLLDRRGALKDDKALAAVRAALLASFPLRSKEIEAVLGAQPLGAPPPQAGSVNDVDLLAQELVNLLKEARRLKVKNAEWHDLKARAQAHANAIRDQFKVGVGSVVAQTKLEQIIGTGAFGTVWQGTHLPTGDRVAVKVFHLEKLDEGQMLQRFRRGVRAMKILSEPKRLAKRLDKRGEIVRFIEADDSNLAFSMEYLSKGDLTDVASQGWSLERKLDVMTHVASAVAYAHANGVIHRDIKPGNVVLNDTSQPVLTDFDIADIRYATEMSTAVEGGLGTPIFAAPEQLEDADSATEASDVYSLGRLFYFLLLERSPGVQVEKDPALENLSHVPPAIVQIVRKATQFSPAKRFASAREFLNALDHCHTGAAAWRARGRNAVRWIARNVALLTIFVLITGGTLGFAFIKAEAAKREAAQRAELEAMLLKISEIEKQKNELPKEIDRRKGVLERLKLKREHEKDPQAQARLDVQILQEMKTIKQLEDLLAERAHELQKLKEKLKKQIATTMHSDPLPVIPQSQSSGRTIPPRAIAAAAAVLDCTEECSFHGLCTTKDNHCVAGSDNDCAKSIGCERAGTCSKVGSTCLATSTHMCEESLNCKEYGTCKFLEGAGLCVRGSDNDCMRASVCSILGACKYKDGSCVAMTDADCKPSDICRRVGRCTAAKDGRCMVASDADCKPSDTCRRLGMCTAKDGRCMAASDAECKSTTACKHYGSCSLYNDRCVARTDGDCAQSYVCEDKGKCTLIDGDCWPGSDVDCKKAGACHKYGWCSYDGRNSCRAAKDSDCEKSLECKQEKKCLARNGFCVAI